MKFGLLPWNGSAVVASVGVVLSCWYLIGAIGCRGEVQNCYEGQGIGDVIDVALIAPYTADGDFVWMPSLETTNPSCEARDGMLTGGTYRFVSVARLAPTGCWAYGSVAVTPLEGVSFGDDLRFGAGIVSSWVPIDDGYWQLLVYPGVVGTRIPFDIEARPGEPPPVVVQRTMSNLRDPACIDNWGGELRRATTTLDVGTRP